MIIVRQLMSMELTHKHTCIHTHTHAHTHTYTHTHTASSNARPLLNHPFNSVKAKKRSSSLATISIEGASPSTHINAHTCYTSASLFRPLFSSFRHKEVITTKKLAYYLRVLGVVSVSSCVGVSGLCSSSLVSKTFTKVLY